MPDPSSLEFTGERVVPGLVDPTLFNEHLARYRFAALFAKGAQVLDAGCGTGYGAAELGTAASVVAMDISAEAVAHARGSYSGAGVCFLQGRCEALPYADESFDLVLAFEVIEHLEHWQKLVSEARRVLRPTGVLLVSTPNKAWYAESRADAGPNPYHAHEFEYSEFQQALAAEFGHVHLWTQNHSELIAFVPSSNSLGILDAQADAAAGEAHFFLAACSQAPIATTSAFGWLASSGNILRERQKHIALLEGEVAKKDQWLAQAETSQSALQREFDKVEAELIERNAWAAHLDREMETARATVADLREEMRLTRDGYEGQIARAEAEAATRLEWITGLEAEIAKLQAEIAKQRGIVDERTAWAQSLDHEMNSEREVFRELEQRHQETQEQLGHAHSEIERLKVQIASIDAAKWVRLGRQFSLLDPPSGEAKE